MASLFSRLCGSSATPATRRSTALHVETLEERLTPSATLADPKVAVWMQNHVLHIEGTNLNDTVAVNRAWRAYNPSTHVYSDWGVNVTAQGKTTWYAAQADDKYYQIVFNGGDGNDLFQNNTGIASIAHGNAGNDTLYGGYGSNALYGDAGNDRLFAVSSSYGHPAGSNFLSGGLGDDYLSGSERGDTLYGDAGNDVLIGNGGNDFLLGGTGKDALYGGFGDDTLDGGDDGYNDYLNGGAGRDRFQMEGYVNRNALTAAFYSNRDAPVDFTAGEDSFYGADLPPRSLGTIAQDPVIFFALTPTVAKTATTLRH